MRAEQQPRTMEVVFLLEFRDSCGSSSSLKPFLKVIMLILYGWHAAKRRKRRLYWKLVSIAFISCMLLFSANFEPWHSSVKIHLIKTVFGYLHLLLSTTLRFILTFCNSIREQNTETWKCLKWRKNKSESQAERKKKRVLWKIYVIFTGSHLQFLTPSESTRREVENCVLSRVLYPKLHQLHFVPQLLNKKMLCFIVSPRPPHEKPTCCDLLTLRKNWKVKI